MKNYTSALAIIMSVSGAYAADGEQLGKNTAAVADTSAEKPVELGAKRPLTKSEQLRAQYTLLAKEATKEGEQEERDRLTKNMEGSLSAAKKKQEEREQKEMIELQNEFADKYSVVLVDRDGKFIEVSPIRFEIGRMKFKEEFRTKLLSTMFAYERQEDLFKMDKKLYVVYKQQ